MKKVFNVFRNICAAIGVVAVMLADIFVCGNVGNTVTTDAGRLWTAPVRDS